MEQGEWAEIVNERDPEEWDWMDEQYFLLGPFFGISMDSYLDTSYVRVKRWINEINQICETDGPGGRSLSLLEHSMFRVASVLRIPGNSES